jgi:hypothetical protein
MGVSGENLFTYLHYNADLPITPFRSMDRLMRAERCALRKLDAVKHIDQLVAVGQEVGQMINLDRHFGPFLKRSLDHAQLADLPS